MFFVDKEIEITQPTTDLNYLERKNIQLRGEIQCLNDRIAGLVKENERLRTEAKIHRAIGKGFDRVKDIVENLKNIWSNLRNRKIEE
jgi:regulator of replication initiation timing